ncbi:hypothetical protein [Neogemmobacter tilapiae]|uniref:Sel1 repeat family protein n=1 Tax=Neogemmobacter tilapiae TaxID=875041 RepID=A0A918WJH5_9RHOB|nr:hypothetical protein [Gemmobacter tilapiae]GHC48610.1 hypothetical protein GCM10007315_08290 [Gemmobacter tilapiae]
MLKLNALSAKFLVVSTLLLLQIATSSNSVIAEETAETELEYVNGFCDYLNKTERTENYYFYLFNSPGLNDACQTWTKDSSNEHLRKHILGLIDMYFSPIDLKFCERAYNNFLAAIKIDNTLAKDFYYIGGLEFECKDLNPPRREATDSAIKNVTIAIDMSKDQPKSIYHFYRSYLYFSLAQGNKYGEKLTLDSLRRAKSDLMIYLHLTENSKIKRDIDNRAGVEDIVADMERILQEYD